jgi:heptaprenyl diphosphate synthase
VNRDEDAYFGSIAGKTASLMATACRIGAIVGGLDRPSVEALTDYGRHVGMIFQIVDDVLDLTATDEELGKPSGLDLAEGIYTLPVIYALRSSQELKALLGQPLDAEGVAQGRALTCADTAVANALAVADEHAAQAARVLGEAKIDDSVTGPLNRLCRSIIDRTRSVPAAAPGARAS